MSKQNGRYLSSVITVLPLLVVLLAGLLMRENHFALY